MKRFPLAALAVLGALLAPSRILLAQCPSVVFTPVQTRTDSPNPIHNLEALDFDGDHVLDLVGLMDSTVVSGSGEVTHPPILTTWKGNGDGTFQAPLSLGTSNVEDLAVADLNHDGHPDLIVAVFNQLVVYLGNGNGFDAPITTSVAYGADRLIAGLFDGDNNVDIITLAIGGVVAVYHGLGNGTFTLTQHIATDYLSVSLAAADFDGDGRTDIAIGHRIGNIVSIIFQNADGSYSAPVVLQNGPDTPAHDNFPSSLVAADLDEDGKPDLVVSNDELLGPTVGIVVFKNLGARTFSNTSLLPHTFHPSGEFWTVRARDLDGDGHLDLIAANPSSNLIMTWIGKGDGTFRSPSYSDTGNHLNFSTAVGDFDGDGHPDIAVGAFQQVIAAKGSCATQVYFYTTAPVITQGQSAPLRVLVSGIAASTPLPRGTITFREGTTSLGTADIDATGYATLDLAGLPLGVHAIVADFGGNSEMGTASSPPLSEEVTTFTSTTTLDLPASSVYGTPYTFTVAIRNHWGNSTYGYVILNVDGVQSERFSDSPISLSLAPGPHTITASFEGDAVNPPSTSGPHPITTLKATPAIATTSGALTVRLGKSHSLQFTLTGPNGVNGPTGTLQLLRGSTVLTSGALVNGVVTLTTMLERGAHDVTALYLGDGNFSSTSMNLTLSVLPNVSLAIEARGLTNAVSVRCVLPSNTTATALYRSPAGTNTWTLVSGWTPLSEFDNTVPLRGVLYDYEVGATVSGNPAMSNIDSALLFNDDPVVAGTTLIKRQHFDELRLVVNALRATAGLAPFNFDATYAGLLVRASHLAGLRTALTEARQALGMLPPAFTDTAAPGLLIKAIHIQELREQAL